MAAVLDYLIVLCVKKLQELITAEAILVLGVKDEIRELQRTMTYAQCFLISAEQRRSQEPAIDNWLGELKDAVYEAEDIIDLISFEGRETPAQHPSLLSSSSVNSTGCTCTGFSMFSCLHNIQKNHKIAARIRNFNSELKKIITTGKWYLKLRNMLPIVEAPAVKLMKTCHLVEPNIVGKETLHDSTRLVKLVLAHMDKKVYKLGIVGTAGVGKTTLAQNIYNDNKIKGIFSKQGWICVSQDYSEDKILKEILRDFSVYQEQGETVSELKSKLATTVKDKSFLLVLDDVWKPEVWTYMLRTPLLAATTGVIIITTRHDTVAKAIGVEEMHRVELMLTDVGWELLWRSMNFDKEKDVQHLRDIGMEIVRKCGRLPLAIKVIASVLATKDKSENEWRKVINKSAWSMGKLPIELRGALYLSYDELPRHLKRCFLYCALYPEDWSMLRDDLIRYWIAQGFVEEQEGQLLEDTAEEYYYELIHRNLLQPVHLYFNSIICNIHDLLRQLAWHLSGDEMFCGDPQSLDANTLSNVRHASISTRDYSVVLSNVDKEQTRVRTLRIHCGKSALVENIIFKRFPRIRVLDLTGSPIHKVPDCLGDLIHLRLLDLDETNIDCLPESVGSLKNLQILNLQGCACLHSLPLAITQLCNLRHLSLRHTPITEVPKGINRLKFLNDLGGFPVGDGHDSSKTQDGWSLEELVPLSQLRCLDMIKLERAIPCSSTDSLLKYKENLRALYLCCTRQKDQEYSKEDVSSNETIFEQLAPPRNLEDLAIVNFFGHSYPTWLCATMLSSLKHLELLGCRSCMHLPPIGRLPYLKYLKILGAMVTKIGPEFVGSEADNPRCPDQALFPKLECLVIIDMPNWEEWSFAEDSTSNEEGLDDGDDMRQKGKTPPTMLHLLPCLEKLYLYSCPKLRTLPRQLGHEASRLKEVHVRDANCLKTIMDFSFLSNFLSISRCKGLERISFIPQVRKLYVGACPNLRCVEGLGNLEQLGLAKDMQDMSLLWVHGLEEQCSEDLEVYTWLGDQEIPIYMKLN